MKAYQEYKASGTDWIGNIPKHWEMRKVSRSFNLIGSGTTPKSDRGDYYDGGTIDWVITGDLNDNYLNKTSKKITQKALDDYTALKMYPPGTLLIAMYGATIGKISLMNFEGCVNQACCALANSSYFYNKFVFYWFLTNKRHIVGLGYGGGQPNISQDIVCSLKISTPPLPEQSVIADFLNTKTSQIDTLIAKKQHQIELLQEHRTALINQAVTKGLNPDTPLKDSGIEWLGVIPSHWIVSKLKYLCYVSDGNHGEEYPKDADFTDEVNGVPFIRVSDLDGINIVRKDLLYITKEKNDSMRKGGLQENDILFVNRGSIGKIATVTKEFEGANLNSQIAYFRVENPNIKYKYLLYFLLSGSFQNLVSSLTHGGALQQLPLKRIFGLEVICPPVEEQSDIISYLDKKVALLGEIIKVVFGQIELFQEYRAALISAVVTGKVDVREENT